MIYCNQCGAAMADDAAACPRCGHRPPQSTQVDPVAVEGSPKEEVAGRRSRGGCGWAMLAGMAVGVALLVVVGLGLLAVYQGSQERARLNRAAAMEHYQKALEQLALGNHEISRAELELTLQLDPNNREAATKLAEVSAVIRSLPTPTSALRYQTAVTLYNEARERYNQQDWEGAISRLEQIRSLEPDYESAAIAQLLADAYLSAGLTLVEQDRLEEGIRYLDRCLELDPTRIQARDEKRWASLYMAGLGYWGADWQGAIESLRVLHQLNPAYRDTKQRLAEAHVAYAEVLSEAGDWCSARDQYDGALAIIRTAEIESRREEASLNCASAPSPSGTPPASGTFVGTLLRVEDVGNSGAMMVRGHVYDAAGQPLSGIRVGLSAFDYVAPPALTNAEGIFAFDGLGNAVTYTVSLLDLPAIPMPVKTDWSKLIWLEFRPQP